MLDTGLSGLEPPHKGPGRRWNKGLFHAAAEKPQISSSVLGRWGGASGASPPDPLTTASLSSWLSSRVPGLGPPCSGAHAAGESLITPGPTASLLFKIPRDPPRTRQPPAFSSLRVPVPNFPHVPVLTVMHHLAIS